MRRTLDVLARAAGPLSLPALEPLVELRRSRLETMLKVLDVDGAVRRVKGGWIATGQQWTYEAERYAWVARQRAAEQQAMREYAERKLGKLSKQLSEQTQVEVELSEQRNPSIAASHVAEATIFTKGPTLRAREASPDMKASIDQLVEKLERQVKRYRERRIIEPRRHAEHNGDAV